MRVAIGETVLATGAAAGEPCRLVNAGAEKDVQIAPRVGGTKPGLFDRGNRRYEDVIEVDVTYASAALAQAGILTRRQAALAASGNLVYGPAEGGNTIGPAECRAVELVEWVGCGITLRYTILAVEA